jgi:putative spermidine/putrescine transport system substrate-binding protein
MGKIKSWCVATAAIIAVVSFRFDAGHSFIASARADAWDAAAAQAQCANFTTYGMAEDGVYGPWFKAMYTHYGWTSCQRTDNDLSSSEVVAAYEAEKNNPKGVIADIGMVFGPEAEHRGLVLKYTPTGSEFIPAEYKQKGGGWIGSVVGAVGFTVNLEAIPNPPRSWADLLKSEYKGKIKGINPTSGGTGFMALLAANYALGGDPKNPDKAYDFFKKLRASGNLYDGDCDIPNLERGECGMKIQYDFYGLAEGIAAMKAKGVKAEFIVPSDGSIWAPSALLPNGFTDKPDLAKAILDWAMTDEAAVAWAQTYAHPMKQVFGGLKLPPEATAQWLPESAYAHVGKLDAFPEVGKVAEEWEAKVLQ